MSLLESVEIGRWRWLVKSCRLHRKKSHNDADVHANTRTVPPVHSCTSSALPTTPCQRILLFPVSTYNQKLPHTLPHTHAHTMCQTFTGKSIKISVQIMVSKMCKNFNIKRTDDCTIVHTVQTPAHRVR